MASPETDYRSGSGFRSRRNGDQDTTTGERRRAGPANVGAAAPAAELELCGHGTLASAHALWECGHLMPSSPARFHTRNGLLTAARRGDWIELDFPATPAAPAATSADLVAALGATPVTVGRSCFDYLIELESEDTVRGPATAGHYRILACALLDTEVHSRAHTLTT